MFDKRSLEDDTVLLVQGPEEANAMSLSVRVASNIAYTRLMLYLVGDAEIEEDQQMAASSDGVLRKFW